MRTDPEAAIGIGEQYRDRFATSAFAGAHGDGAKAAFLGIPAGQAVADAARIQVAGAVFGERGDKIVGKAARVTRDMLKAQEFVAVVAV